MNVIDATAFFDPELKRKAELARIIGVHRQNLRAWEVHHGGAIPPLHQYRLHKLSGGKLAVNDPFFEDDGGTAA